MRIWVLIIAHFIFLNESSAQIDFKNTSKSDNTKYRDTCYELHQQAGLRRIGQEHDQPIYIANGILVRMKEIEVQKVDSIAIIKCPESFEMYGDAGELGVISITTKQTFKTITLSDLGYLKESGDQAQTTFAINGFIITDTSLKISRKAIRRIEVIAAGARQYETACINVWTVTRKEIRQYKRRPKLCRGLGNAHSRFD